MCLSGQGTEIGGVVNRGVINRGVRETVIKHALISYNFSLEFKEFCSYKVL